MLSMATALALAEAGAKLYLLCRSREKGAQLVREIAAIAGAPKASLLIADLGDYDSIREAVRLFLAEGVPLHVLINNAGIMMGPFGTTVDGFERQFGTNHLGHFALAGLLLNFLLETPDSRVVNVSSSSHRFGTMDFKNLMYARGKDYLPARAYGRSKLANLL